MQFLHHRLLFFGRLRHIVESSPLLVLEADDPGQGCLVVLRGLGEVAFSDLRFQRDVVRLPLTGRRQAFLPFLDFLGEGLGVFPQLVQIVFALRESVGGLRSLVERLLNLRSLLQDVTGEGLA